MAKIERESEKFKPYKIVIETWDEHLFLLGLFGGGHYCQKHKCDNYNLIMNKAFFSLLSQDINIKED